jgi:hypothetical protein
VDADLDTPRAFGEVNLSTETPSAGPPLRISLFAPRTVASTAVIDSVLWPIVMGGVEARKLTGR